MAGDAPTPPPLGPAPAGGDVDRAGKLIAIYWAEMFFAILIVALRFYARGMNRNVGADDWMMLVTLVSQTQLSTRLKTHIPTVLSTYPCCLRN